MSNAVAHSAGTAAPRVSLPAHACDCHIHIYEPRYATPGAAVLPNATVAEYRKLQARTGSTRTVIVNPAAHAFDNRATLEAIAQLGPDKARGVAVLKPEVTDTQLGELHAGGIRGIRFTLFDPRTAVTRFEWVEPLSRRVHELGWHTQLHWRGDQIVEHSDLISRLPGIIVFDHMGRLPRPEGALHPAFAIVARLMEQGRAWVKLSGPYLDDVGPDYPSRAAVVRAYARIAPQRLVWGSDWPHPTEKERKPDDAHMLDLFAGWLGDAHLRQRILVDNPEQLYGFAPA
jgi:predicted TIM-barrel fold metal-dependent hydrolase